MKLILQKGAEATAGLPTGPTGATTWARSQRPESTLAPIGQGPTQPPKTRLAPLRLHCTAAPPPQQSS